MRLQCPTHSSCTAQVAVVPHAGARWFSFASDEILRSGVTPLSVTTFWNPSAQFKHGRSTLITSPLCSFYKIEANMASRHDDHSAAIMQKWVRRARATAARATNERPRRQATKARRCSCTGPAAANRAVHPCILQVPKGGQARW